MATTETNARTMRADARRNRELIISAARELVAEQGEGQPLVVGLGRLGLGGLG